MNPITQPPWRLVLAANNEPVYANQKYPNFRGQMHSIIGGHPPEHNGSTGRVYTDNGSEFFPNVFDMKWSKA